jgi:hypothetical protein
MDKTKIRLFSLVCAAVIIIATASTVVYARQSHIVTTGCLQAGMDPNTYVLYSDSPGKYGSNNGNPSAIARAEASSIRISPEDKADLQRYVGHRTRVKGTLIYRAPASGSIGSVDNTTPVAALGPYDLKITSIHRIAGT